MESKVFLHHKAFCKTFVFRGAEGRHPSSCHSFDSLKYKEGTGPKIKKMHRNGEWLQQTKLVQLSPLESSGKEALGKC